MDTTFDRPLAPVSGAPSAETTTPIRIARINLLRGGYLLLAVGLALTKWPVMLRDPASLPLFEGVVAAMLTAMSLLAIHGLRYPIRMRYVRAPGESWR